MTGDDRSRREAGVWLNIVGIDEDGLAGLSGDAKAAIAEAEMLIGGIRHLAMIPDSGCRRMVWAKPLADTLDQIVQMAGEKVCVLASGDPMHYGVGARLCRLLPEGGWRVFPNISCFSLLAARMGWSLADLTIVPTHGRPLSLLNRHLAPGRRLIALSNDGDTPNQLAERLCQQGYGDSKMTVFEHLGGDRERRFEGLARDWRRRVEDLNCMAIHCRGDARALPATGLADDLFDHDGQLTKREVRAVTMASLTPAPGELLWDVGCGAGSIAIEWLRQEPDARALAIDRDAGRVARAEANAARFGVPQLRTVIGDAPHVLVDLPDPDAVFLGGGVADPDLLARCWVRLKPGGVLAANAVTMEAEAVLLEHAKRQGGEMIRIAIAHLEPLGPSHAWRDRRPVVHYRGYKP